MGFNQIQWNTLVAGALCIAMAIIVVVWVQPPLSDPLEITTSKHLRYQQQVERQYVRRISTLLSSLLDHSDLYIEVNTKLDFSSIPAQVKRLTVVVIFNDQLAIDDTRLAQLAGLIELTVGIDQQRGDSLSLTRLPFHQSGLDALSLPLIKQLLAGGGLIGLILLLWPVVRSLSRTPAAGSVSESTQSVPAEAVCETRDKLSEAVFESYSERVLLARQMADQDPRHVAQIVKLWMADHG